MNKNNKNEHALWCHHGLLHGVMSCFAGLYININKMKTVVFT